MGDIKVSINRQGEFTLTNALIGKPQCGTQGVRHYKYHVKICATNKAFTPDGFVIDNAEVDNYFKDKYQDKTMAVDSCEVMVCDAISHFRKLFAEDEHLKQVELVSVYVRIHGADISFIEGEWHK